MISNQNNNLLIILFISIVIFIIYCICRNNETFNTLNSHTLKTFNKENFSRIIPRYQNATLENNTCKKPFTNSKRNTPCSKPVYTFQFGNRMLINPNDYNKMVKKVLDDLRTINENENYNFDNNNLIEEDYKGDQSQIINLLNSKLKKLSETKSYLQNNGAWKYEQYYASEPTIYFYRLKEPSDVFLFKIIFTLENPLRSSYTNCYAFISLKNPTLNNINGITNNLNNMNIIKAGIVSEDSTNSEMFENKNYINSENAIDKLVDGQLNYTFLNVMPQLEFDQWGHPVNNSGIQLSEEVRQGTPVKIEPEIPSEFKDPDFKMQYLPPEFGNGICDYPPKYTLPNGNTYFMNNPPVFVNA